MKKTKQKVVVIGGGETFDTYEKYLNFLKKNIRVSLDAPAKDDWKKNLQKHLGKNFEVIRVSMPCALNAKYREWELYFRHVELALGDSDVIFVCHSLGALFIMQYLYSSLTRNNITVKGLILVAPPFNVKQHNGFADFILPRAFDRTKRSYTTLGKVTENIHIFQSNDDTIVEPVNAARYYSALQFVTLHRLEGYGHFITQTKIPAVLRTIKKLAK